MTTNDFSYSRVIMLKNNNPKIGKPIFEKDFFKGVVSGNHMRHLSLHDNDSIMECVVHYKRDLTWILENNPDTCIYKIYKNPYVFENDIDYNCSINSFHDIKNKYKNHIFFKIPVIREWIYDNLTLEQLKLLMQDFENVCFLQIKFDNLYVNFNNFINNYLYTYSIKNEK